MPAGPARPWALLAAVTVGATAAVADNISGYVEGGYTHSTTDSTDAAGATQSSSANFVFQRYRLALDRAFLPTLRFTGGGLFERDITWTATNGVERTFATNLYNVNADLILGLPTSFLGGGYYRRQSGNFVAQDYHLFGTWKPLGLPTLSLRLAAPENYDVDRRTNDVVSKEASLAAAWTPIRNLQLTYNFAYSNPEDRIHHSESTSTSHNFTAGYTDAIIPRRVDYSLGVTASRLDTEIVAVGAGGAVETPQAPIAGYSLVEVPPATRELDTLQANAALLNGDRTASAGINLGTSRPLANDAYYRDMGVQFQDTITPVNTVWVWIDHDVSEVAGAIVFTAWKSDDNSRWTSVAVTRQVFSGFANRFEITIEQTQARYLKVVARPLDPAVSTRDVYRDILVTELQALLVQPIDRQQRQLTNTYTFTGGLRAQLLPNLLIYDAGLNLHENVRPGVGSTTTWYLVNGLTLNKQVSEIVLLSARAARQDSDQLRGHEWSYLWTASVAVNELPTLNHSLTYGGQALWTAGGIATTNSIVVSTQAVPYRNITVGGSAGYNVSTTATDRNTVSTNLTFETGLQPHRMVSLHGAFTHTDAVSTGGGVQRFASATNVIEGTATVRPAQLLFVTGSVSRVINPPRADTLFNGLLGVNATAGGDLQLSVAFSSVLDVDGSVTRFFTPSARWYIRRNTVLTATYTMVDGDRGGGSQQQRAVTVDLRIVL